MAAEGSKTHRRPGPGDRVSRAMQIRPRRQILGLLRGVDSKLVERLPVISG